MPTSATEPHDNSEIAGVLDRNIHAIIQSRKDEEKNISWQDRIAQTITGFIGMGFVFLHLLIFSIWVFVNSGLIPLLRFDPTLSILAILISMEAIFLSTFVLINQNRMGKINVRQADLNLQVGLLAEHEITHLIQLVTAIANKMHLEKAKNPELDELQKEIKPERILEEIEKREDKANRDDKAGQP